MDALPGTGADLWQGRHLKTANQDASQPHHLVHRVLTILYRLQSFIKKPDLVQVILKLLN